MLELDTEQLNAKPIRIKLKAGFYITGIIQMGAAIFCNEDQIPFISTPNLQRLHAYLGNLALGKTHISITEEQARTFLEFIPREEIVDFEIMETAIKGIRLITRKNREIRLHGFTIQVSNTLSPGMAGVEMKIPGHDKLFDVGERVIKESYRG